jgi:hypothetical protein
MARSTLVRTVILGAALGIAALQGCAKQAEGERCEPSAANDSDCDDGLVCVPGKELLDDVPTADDFGRCCPPAGEAIGDSRCARVGSIAGSPSPGGTAGAPSEAGAAGMSSSEGGAPASSGGAAGNPAAAGAAAGGQAAGASGSPAGGQGGELAAAGAGGA